MVPRCTATTFNGRACATVPLHLNPIKGKETRKVTSLCSSTPRVLPRLYALWPTTATTALLLTNLTRSTRRSYSAVAAHQFLNLFAKLLPLSLINIFTVINPMPWASCRMAALNISMIKILSSIHDHQLIPARDGNAYRHNVMRIARQVLPHHLQRHPSFLQKSFLLGFFPFYHRHTTAPLSTSVSFNFFQVSSWQAALTSCFRKAPSISSTLLPPPPMFSRLINFWYALHTPGVHLSEKEHKLPFKYQDAQTW